MACFDMKKSCGCRMAARNAYARGVRTGMPAHYAVSRQNGACEPPFYCGPCGPAEPVNDCTGLCPPGSLPPQYAVFEQTGTLLLAAGEAIPFEDAPVDTPVERITLDEGVITLPRAGVYMASLMMMIPAAAAVEDTISIRKNDEEIPGGSLTIDKTATDAASQTGVQVVFQAAAGDTLSVISENGLDLTAETQEGQLAVLTIVKLG